jgi:DNA modification methylase
MGKSWDSFVPHPDIWREAYRVLKPGGYALVFAGTRTQDLMTIALRLAGFEVRDVIEWLYFSGFPKSMDVGKAFDKKNGSSLAQQEEAERFGAYLKELRAAKGYSMKYIDDALGLNTSYSWWEGRKRGVQPPSKANYLRLKPILDLDDRYDEFIERAEAERDVIGKAKWATLKEAPMPGADCSADNRVIRDITAPATPLARQWNGWGTALKPAHEPIIVVRKPLIGTVADTVERYGTGAINIDGCRIPSEAGTDTRRNSSGGDNGLIGSSTFKIRERRAEDSPEQTGRFPANCITTVDDAFYSPYFNVSPAELSKKAGKRDRGEGNTHPTVKPTELMAWLVRLVTPPGGVVLDPFAGSGSTLVAAEREGFCFVGIERELEYIDIIKNRLQSKDVTIHDAGR